jgi:hypothetical protein
MDGELASVRGIIDLSPQEALDSAEAFLMQQGYTRVSRADDSLTVERRPPDQAAEQEPPRLTVSAVSQPGGGVRMAVSGDDRQGLQERQDAFMEWSESLPKKPREGTGQPEDQQSDMQTHEVPLPPPPTVETQDLPPAPQPPPGTSYAPPPTAGQRSGMGTGMKLALGGCIGLILLGLLTVGGCFALIANVDTSTDSESGSSEGKQKSGSSKAKQAAVAIDEPVIVGDVTWTVTSAKQSRQLTQQGVTKQFADNKQGNFVIVDFDFTNNGSDAITLDNESLALVDSGGSESKPSSDDFLYVPENRRIFLERINPGVTRQGEAIFEVAPGASGFQLQAGDAQMFTDENGYVDLGF